MNRNGNFGTEKVFSCPSSDDLKIGRPFPAGETILPVGNTRIGKIQRLIDEA